MSPARRSAAKLLSKDEARRIAVNKDCGEHRQTVGVAVCVGLLTLRKADILLVVRCLSGGLRLRLFELFLLVRGQKSPGVVTPGLNC